LPDQAEIHKKCIGKMREECWEALKLLKTHFSNLPDKDQAWQDLLRLTQDKDSTVQWRSAKNLRPAFSHVPDKDQAWKALIKLTQDEDRYVRLGAAEAFVSAIGRRQVYFGFQGDSEKGGLYINRDRHCDWIAFLPMTDDGGAYTAIFAD